MMEFQLTADPTGSFHIIAFELANDGLSAHYQWRLALRCQRSHANLLRQWGRVLVRNGFGQRYWHGCITQQTDYGVWQGWHYWQIILASPLAVLARLITSQTWVAQSAVTILLQLFEQTQWRQGIDFVITITKPPMALPFVIRYNESSLSVLDRICTQCGWIFYWQQTAQHSCLHIVDQLPDPHIEFMAVEATGLLRPHPTFIQLKHTYYWHVDRIHWQRMNAAQPERPLQCTSRNQTQCPGYQTSHWITEHPPAVTLWQQQLDWQRQLILATSDAVQLAPGQLIQVTEDEQTVCWYRVLQLQAQGEWFSCFHAGDTLPEALAKQLPESLPTGFWPQCTLYPATCDYRKPNEFTARQWPVVSSRHMDVLDEWSVQGDDGWSSVDDASAVSQTTTQRTFMTHDFVCSWGCCINPPLPNTLLTQTISRGTGLPVLSDNGHYYVQWLFERTSASPPICLLPVAHLNQFHWPHYPHTWLVTYCFTHEVAPRFCIIGALPNQTTPDVLTAHASTPALMRHHNQMTWQVDDVAMTWGDSKQQTQITLPVSTNSVMKLATTSGDIYFASDDHGQLGCDLNLWVQAANIHCTAGRHQGWRTQHGDIKFSAKRQLRLQAGLNVMGLANQMVTVAVQQRCQWQASGNMHWLAHRQLSVESQQTIHLNYQTHAHWYAGQQGITLAAGLGQLHIKPQVIELDGTALHLNAGVIYRYVD